MNYLLAIDEGTSSTRAMLYSQDGNLVSSCQRELTQYYPRAGWVEHDPEEIWSRTLEAIQHVTKDIDKTAILACGITNQRETTVMWDKQTGKCISKALVWQDRRTDDYCKSISEYEGLIHQKTGLKLDPYFSASKVHWLLNQCPEAADLVKEDRLAFGTIDTFLIWRLTGGKAHATDATNASRTMLYNIFENEWDDELLALFGVPHSILPEVLDSDGQFGTFSSTILGEEIPITGVAGDQQAALIGQRCYKKGMMKATYGTGGFLMLNTGDEPVLSKHKLLTTIAYRTKGKVSYGLEGSLYQAGTTVKWLRDEMKLIRTSAETESLARSLSSNGGVYLIPSFTGLGAPHWLSTEGALIVGLSRKSSPAHFARAALESVVYQTRDVLEAMLDDSGMDLTVLRVDGGMSENNWFLQYLASQTNLVVQRPTDIETTALGAALLAGVGCSVFGSLDELGESWSFETEFLPEGDRALFDNDYDGWLKALGLIQA
jgi:glycerol kinase